MRHPPSDAVFAAHGLHNVTLDIPKVRTVGSDPTITLAPNELQTSEWTTGSAELSPNDQYPLLTPHRSATPSFPVRFSFCPPSDGASMSRFRRRAQLLALDTVPTAPGPSTAKFGRVNEVIAWWEDGHGLWFIVDEETDEGASVVEEWCKIMQDPDMEDVADNDKKLSTNMDRRERMSSKNEETAYAEVCFLLVKVVTCLRRNQIAIADMQSLHARHLSKISCRPCSFNIVKDANAAVLNRFDAVLPLSTLNVASMLKDHPLSNAGLFQRESIEPSESRLDDFVLRKNLRYLAPEMAIQKRVSKTGDIYSFGVLVHELLTGATIDGGPDSPEETDIDVLIDFHRHVTMKITPPLDWLQREAALGAMYPALPPRQLSDIVMRCLGKEPDVRYSSLESVAYDLTTLGRILKNHGDMSKFKVGEVDRIATFTLPPRIVQRDSELARLNKTLDEVVGKQDDTFTTRTVTVSGTSGSGKTRIVRQFVQDMESPNAPYPVAIAWAKLDESIHPPLSSFSQIFAALLDRFLADPNEDVAQWNEKIRDTLGPRFHLFVSLVPTEYWRILGVGNDSRPAADIDWGSIKVSFTAWARQLLQLFATRSRPLIVVLDDLQWLPSDEVQHWRSILAGNQAVNHLLLISTCRTTSNNTQPPNSVLLSPSTMQIPVPPLSEQGIHALIKESFHDRITSSVDLASFLHAETGGLSLYVRTILAGLVRESVISFDYETLSWCFDVVQLQQHLSKAGVDAYLEKLIKSLPLDAQDLLHHVSCLPNRGFSVEQLQDLLDKPKGTVEALIMTCSSTATLLGRRGSLISFAHDGRKAVALRLIPPESAARIHGRISTFLRQPRFGHDFVFDAADHALQAKKLGGPTEDANEYVDCLLKAVTRTAMAGDFSLAMRFLDAVEDAINESGGIAEWMKSRRELYTRYLQLYAEIGCIVQSFQQSCRKLDEARPWLTKVSEKILVETLRLRLLVAGGRLAETIELTFAVLKENGYELSNPVDPSFLPQTPDDVDEIERGLQDGPIDREDVRVQIMSLLGFAATSIFWVQPHRRAYLFGLGLWLAMQVNKIHETTAFFVSAYALVITDVKLKRAVVTLGQKMLARCPFSNLVGLGLNAAASQAHNWLPWTDLTAQWLPAIEGTISHLSFEQAQNAMAFDLGGKVLRGISIQLELTAKRYETIRPFITQSGQVFIKLHLQYIERIGRLAEGPTPWELEGSLVTPQDMGAAKDLPLIVTVRDCLALRLAVFYDAPLDRLDEMVETGRASEAANQGVIYAPEWAFLVALVAIRGGKKQSDIDRAKQILSSDNESPDYADRLLVIETFESLNSTAEDILCQAEAAIDGLQSRQQHALAGLLSHSVAQAILRRTKSERLAAGFLREASLSYRQAQMFGLCNMLRQQWPASCPSCPGDPILPSHVLGFKDTMAPPPLRRASTSNSGETIGSLNSSAYEKTADAKKSSSDQLDAMTLMRSSLALASEQDPPILLCTLLRILCQFLRAEYAAIALSDDTDDLHVRLRAAGPFSRIVPYDIRMVDDAAKHVCPATVMLHTARTGKAITSLASFPRSRSDPFYADRLPRSVVCLPIMMQGKQKGVVLLSSTMIAATQGQWEAAREVVATLATFAVIITSNVSFTKRLKQEVDQRTSELTNALAAKTQFLSQCSHELRSPLSAVLGLAAVLEASSGLSEVQREHLRTIISSGEDLLGLINNILDHSRLESGSVTLESIPFSCRDVVEGALDSVAAVAQKKNLEICLLNPVDEDPPGLIGDPFRIKQILLNLLSNAVKFTEKGRVTVKWRWESGPDDKVKIEMDVEDTGIGIPAQKMDKLFRSFSQVDESITRSFGGSGLGLIISKDLARLLGGDCEASSEFGRGSKFTFSLVADKNPQHETYVRRLEKPKSCFIICDSGPWWEMLDANLRLLHCEPVRFADDVQDCLVKDHPDGLNSRKQFDYILINTQMVDQDTLNRMRALQNEAKMLYLVRSIDLAKTIRDFDITREAIVSRPIKFSSLMRALLPPGTKDASTGKPNGLDKSDKGNKKVNRKLASTNPLSILLVDDNAVNVTVGKRILEMFGYKDIASAGDGQQAIDAAEKQPYDLILLDLQMPVLDGFTAQERIRASPLAGDPCIVALTANADQGTQQVCADAGFFSYLSKPLDIQKFQKILEEVSDYRKKHLLVQTHSQAEIKAQDGSNEHDEKTVEPGLYKSGLVPESRDEARSDNSDPAAEDVNGERSGAQKERDDKMGTERGKKEALWANQRRLKEERELMEIMTTQEAISRMPKSDKEASERAQARLHAEEDRAKEKETQEREEEVKG